jgi:ABC-2 type transport system ATP-binding protein
MSAAIAVQAENLTIAFGDFKAVDDISFCVERGEIFGFLGANGAGKTTTIRALCGLLAPTAGSAEVAGLAVIEKNLMKVKSVTGYMSQRFTLYPDMTVDENINFTGALRKMSAVKIRARAKELFSFTGFNNPRNVLVKNLPGGARQVVALCACLLHDPEIIFLDEPTAGVSPSSRALFWDLIRSLAGEGKTVFVTTHYMDEAEQCGRITLMQSGRIIALDTPQNLKTSAFPTPLYEITPLSAAKPDFAKRLCECGAGTVQPCGMRWHVDIRDEKAWDIFAASAAGEFERHRIPPSLEDVFLKLVGGGK